MIVTGKDLDDFGDVEEAFPLDTKRRRQKIESSVVNLNSNRDDPIVNIKELSSRYEQSPSPYALRVRPRLTYY